jgi:fructose-bisphosphate aldolase/6-deoxy-5-ketofructose 1-phosphate synthase
MTSASDVTVPLDVPEEAREIYLKNFETITHGTGRLMLFAGDQRVEHLNADFYGEGIHEDDADPEHLFRIAQQSRIGVFATQLGQIAQFGRDYPDVPYLVKINSKTNLVKTDQQDPMSNRWYNIDQIVRFREQSGLKITAVGYTIYLGSEFEGDMLHQAAQVVNEAHQHGLLTVLWVYPRGSAVKDEKDPHLIAGAVAVAACLGSDFVKVNAPKKDGVSSADQLKEATTTAGRTKVVCAGGSSIDVAAFLQQLYDQIHIGGTSGNATGRNIHQKSLDEAVRMCNAISAITMDDASAEEALRIYEGK